MKSRETLRWAQGDNLLGHPRLMENVGPDTLNPVWTRLEVRGAKIRILPEAAGFGNHMK